MKPLGSVETEPEVHIHDASKLRGALKAIGGSMSDDWNNILANQTIQTLWLKNSDAEEGKRQRHAAVDQSAPADARVCERSIHKRATFGPCASRYLSIVRRSGRQGQPSKRKAQAGRTRPAPARARPGRQASSARIVAM